ncbi:potassium transporter [Pseudidiomarina aestuarii]|uniref:Trk system potassium uptake protein n=1 Tax=Pseudidiomarina aestuarii TaxID=624146 RepID=A0A7Z7ETN1_9GAMM|nr:potassium transporter TrkG [Pseudidiomarina aestuarii]RUO41200.1 potassium transporter [Pseudidiomarina aestuarii]
MVNARTVVKLLVYPIHWLAGIQFVFAVLSVTVFQDLVARWFFASSLIWMLIGVLIWTRLRKHEIQTIRIHDGLLFAVLTWIIAGTVGALPIYWITEVSWTDAMFESVSALTTTGATILTGLDIMAPSFLLYRQFLQWTGGLGVVIFVVALLPMLNVGGMRLLIAETPGPIKNDKIAPRIGNASRYLWLVYLAITVACAACYWSAGMSFYDAIAHSFTTVSTGGFSTHDASLGYFESNTILWIANVFMVLGAISFALHWRINAQRQWLDYWRDEETRIFLCLVLSFGLIVTAIILSNDTYASTYDAVSQSFFHIISFMTSTGYGATDLSTWPLVLPLVLVFVSYLGGCAGSTAGGNKIIRDIIAFKLIKNQFSVLLHPRAVKQIRYQDKIVADSVVTSIIAFLLLSALSTIVFTFLLVAATGFDFWSAFTAVAACLNVLGPGFGEVGSNFINVSDSGIWILNFAMLLGRLEYFTLIALLLPEFWRE